MLIDDLEYFKNSKDYNSNVSGMDQSGKHNYSFNSWGFRGPDYSQYIGQSVNICLGDSFTVNVGGPIEHSWCSQLAERFNIPTLNLGMDGAGNDAIYLLYQRAYKLFDVKSTFVMYSYLHRRLIDGRFGDGKFGINQLDPFYDNKNFDYFLKHRIPNAIECSLPVWNWKDEEKNFLEEKKIYYLPNPGVFSEHQDMDRTYVNKKDYNSLRGPNWPTFREFQNGADPHPDMLTNQFGRFVSVQLYQNVDGHHCSHTANKKYATYLYQQWKQNNES